MRLVTVAHGTRSPAGNLVARQLTAAAARRLGVTGTASFVELCEPLLADVMAQPPVGGARDGEETVVVPLLLSRGYHVAVDLPAAVLRSGGTVTLAPPLGPHAHLTHALAARLLEAGASVGQRVVLVSAGSRDPRGAEDLRNAADLLSVLWRAPVEVAAFAGPLPRPRDVIRSGDAVSPYLLAAGHFADRVAEDAASARADVVAGVIGPHEAVVDLVVERALHCDQPMSRTSTRSPARTASAPSGTTA